MATRAKTSKVKSAVKRAVRKAASKLRAVIKSPAKAKAKAKTPPKTKTKASKSKPGSAAAKPKLPPKPKLPARPKAAATRGASSVPKIVAKPWQSAKEQDKLTVEQYVATKVPPPWRSVMAELRMVVKTACPEAEECMKWGQPVYECDGAFAWMKAHRDHVNFGFFRGSELVDTDGILEGEGDRMRHVKIRDPEQVPVSVIDALIRQAVTLNREKGDPTRRRA